MLEFVFIDGLKDRRSPPDFTHRSVKSPDEASLAVFDGTILKT